jgi:aryl-alcohol dehydrogenase-like predicted oxidoreductase
MTFGSPVPEPDAIRLVHQALDLGINFIDTANAYEGYNRVLGSPGGVAEEILGKALVNRRDRVVLATKAGAPVGAGPQDRGLSACHLMRALETSLHRLRTDVIDLYVLHWPDRATPLETTLATLELAVRQGKIRYFGASNHRAAQLCELLWLADKRSWPVVAASQIPFSLLRRDLDADLDFCAAHDIAVTPYQPLQGGLLTGKYRRGAAPPDDSRGAEKPDWIWKTDATLFQSLEGLADLAAEAGTNMTRYALAWTLAQPAMASLIVGCKRAEQLEDALGALEVAIPPEHFAKINALCPPPWRLADPVRGAQVIPIGK